MNPTNLSKKSSGMLLFIILLLPLQLWAQSPIAAAIKQNRAQLHYPLSVERFYKQEGFRFMWVLKDTLKNSGVGCDANIGLCLQYGLNSADYHPQELTYEVFHKVQAVKAINNDKACFDVILTDAIIILINNLHYGKLNPDFPLSKVDTDDITQFKGDKALLNAQVQDRAGI
ncbi:MAG: hypothetical protein JWQ79_2707 [Mucilaginibacter sp.]|nr:hypothetical protein [Mucilaginibacter sp.]